MHYRQIVQENSSKTPSKSLWRMFSNDWVSTNILNTRAAGIKNDLREGTTQISEL